MSLDNLVLAAQQKADGTTGDTTGGPLGINHAAATGDVLKQVAEGQINGFKALGEPLTVPGPDGKPAVGPDGKPRAPQGALETAVAVTRRAQQALGAIGGLGGALENALDMGFAALTAPLAALFPSIPSAPMGSIYIGIPHAHPHPPSLIPPNPVPVPLPSFGPVLLGNSVQVLIMGMPAGRAGDKGIAPTCCGFTPFFDIKLGSSNVFIGGKRAARIGDMCEACTPGGGAGGALSAVGKVMAVAGKVAQVAGTAASVLGIAADIGEAVILADDNAALAAGKALNAAMVAAQMASDAAAAAAVVVDAAVAPGGPSPKGAIAVPLGLTVLIGGFPMMNTLEFAKAILNKLKALARGKPPGEGGNPHPGPED